MSWIIYITLLLTWLGSSKANNAPTDKDESTSTCDENWVFLDGFCYFFSDSEDTVNPIDATDKCILYDAEYAYPKSKKELTFMQSQSKARTAYGWSMNIEKDFYEDRYNTLELSSDMFFKTTTITPGAESIPELQKSFDTDNKCVALHIGDKVSKYWSSKKPEISTEPCEVKLWVVCEGKTSKFPNQVADYEKWFSNGKLIFWLSGKLANQAEAKALCENENMDLVTSIIDLMEALNGTYELTPWWTGLKLGKNGPENEDGAEVDLAVVPWLLESSSHGTAHIMLLHSGKARYVRYDYKEESALPYICKKRAQTNGLFGCPYLWIRGGRSCYYFVKYKSLQWSKAKETCEARGSHLLSIDSLDEKLWLETVVTRYIGTMWTSANDLDVEGKFKWHDGSTIDNKVLTWQKAPFNKFWMIYYDDCISFEPKRSYISGRSSNGRALAACQYELEEGTTQCEDEWSRLDDTCYFLDFNSDSMSYELNKRHCRNVLKHRFASPLMVKTRKIADFISKIYESKSTSNYFQEFWLGMSRGEDSSHWRWYDYSIVDFSVFGKNDEPDNGNEDGPENCVAVNSLLLAYDASCDERIDYICEKELTPVSALGFVSDSAPSLCVLIYILALSLLINVLLVYWV